MIGPVRSRPALNGTNRSFVALPGPSRPCRFCLALPCYTLPGAVLTGPARHCPVLPYSAVGNPAWTWLTQLGATLSCLGLHCLKLPSRPCPVLLAMPSLVRFCPALSVTDRPSLAPPDPARSCPALPDPVPPCLTLPARPCPAHLGLVLSCPQPSLACVNWVLHLSFLFCAMHFVYPICTVICSKAKT